MATNDKGSCEDWVLRASEELTTLSVPLWLSDLTSTLLMLSATSASQSYLRVLCCYRAKVCSSGMLCLPLTAMAAAVCTLLSFAGPLSIAFRVYLNSSGPISCPISTAKTHKLACPDDRSKFLITFVRLVTNQGESCHSTTPVERLRTELVELSAALARSLQPEDGRSWN